ncbi:hypothetical protein ACWDXV_34215 [Nocardia nova]
MSEVVEGRVRPAMVIFRFSRSTSSSLSRPISVVRAAWIAASERVSRAAGVVAALAASVIRPVGQGLQDRVGVRAGRDAGGGVAEDDAGLLGVGEQGPQSDHRVMTFVAAQSICDVENIVAGRFPQRSALAS